MKKIVTLAAVVWLSLTCIAQTQSWKEFNDFHNLVSKTLHPVIAGNVQPLKQNSSSLLSMAKAWQSSAIPTTVDSTVFKAQIAGLVKQCSELDDAVKSKQSDSELIKRSKELHETFHALLKACGLKE